MLTLYLYISAFFLDLIFGDPLRWPHPVRWIGRLITVVERVLRRYATSANALYVAGFILWLVVVGSSFALCWAALHFAYQWQPTLGALLELWLAYSVLATRSLNDAALSVMLPLVSNQLPLARAKLAEIVGRDTAELDPAAVSRATIETVAENCVDGVIAPLLYLFIGGAPLAIAYKAINTLDSMVGYRHAHYRQLGFVSAKMDDAANYLPARLGWLLLAGASGCVGGGVKSALKIGWRDRYQHASPNSAWSEAAVAGGLGIRLGGPSCYFGQWVDKPWLGEATREVQASDILTATRMMWVAASLALGLCVLASLLMRHLVN